MRGCIYGGIKLSNSAYGCGLRAQNRLKFSLKVSHGTVVGRLKVVSLNVFKKTRSLASLLNFSDTATLREFSYLASLLIRFGKKALY
jgi:hypothetical protein